MPVVPKYNNVVEQQTPNVALPPSNNRAGVANAINSTFEANQGIAKVGGQLAEKLYKHAQERQLLADKADVSDRELKYKNDLQDLLYSPEPIEIDRNGQKIKTTKGLLTRPLEQADGITDEYVSKTQELKNRWLNGVRTKDQAIELNNSLENISLSKRDGVIRHQAGQMRESWKTKFEANQNQLISTAANVTDKDQLDFLIGDIYTKQSDIDQITGKAKEVTEYNQKDKAGDAVLNSTQSLLTKTGSLEKAQALLDSVKDRILPDKYSTILEKLTSDKKKIDQLAKQNIQQQKDELYSKLFDGNLTLREVENLNRPVENGGIGGASALDLKNKIIKGQSVELKNITTDEKSAKDYVSLVDKLIENDADKFDLKKVLTDAWADGVISSPEAKSLDKIKQTLNDMKWNGKSDPLSSSVRSIKAWFGSKNKSNTELASALKSFLTSTPDMDSLDDQKAKQSVQNIIMNQQVKDNPALGLLPDSPNQTMNPDGTINDNLPGVRNIQSDKNVNPMKYRIMKDKSGRQARVYENGKIEVIK